MTRNFSLHWARLERERRRVGAVTKRSSLQLATPASREVCVLCQLFHVGKEAS